MFSPDSRPAAFLSHYSRVMPDSQAIAPAASSVTHVPADGAQWIHDVVRARAPQAEICLDAFHVAKWAGERLDELRHRLAGELRAAGRGDQAAALIAMANYAHGGLCPDSPY